MESNLTDESQFVKLSRMVQHSDSPPPPANDQPESQRTNSDQLLDTIKEGAEKCAASRPGRLVKRIVVMVVGSTVLALGVALLVLPGPAIVVIPCGLAILAIEFAWARRWLRKSKKILEDPKEELKHLNPFNHEDAEAKPKNSTTADATDSRYGHDRGRQSSRHH